MIRRAICTVLGHKFIDPPTIRVGDLYRCERCSWKGMTPWG